jgi:Zn-finger nucleic acid-binding protein
MDCPACKRPLKQEEIADITVDVCEGGCGGIWFDRFELQKFDEKHESAGEALLDVSKDPGVKVDPSERRRCPKCMDFVLLRHFFSVKREVVVDECAGCGGFWLDTGELSKIREQFGSEGERKAAAEAYFDEVFGEKLTEMSSQGQEKLDKAKKVARAFRFICPSYYIKGKQKWGAF